MTSVETPQRSRMPAWLERILRVPYTDPELNWRGFMFNAILLTGILVCLGILADLQLLAYWYPDFHPALLNGIMVAAIGAYAMAYVANRQGYLEIAGRIYLFLLVSLSLAATLLYDGFTSSAVGVYVWVMIGAVLILPLRDGAIVAGSLVAVYGLIGMAQGLGMYRPPFSMEPNLRLTAMATLNVLDVTGATVAVALMVWNLYERLDTTRVLAQELNHTRQTLEQRVAERTAKAERGAQRFQTIAELSQSMTSVRDLESLLQTTAQLIAERMGYDHVGIFLLDKERQWAVLRAASSEGGKRMLARGHRLHVGVQGIVGNVAFSGIPRIALDVGADAVWFNNPDLPNTRSEMALPLVVREQIIGVLDIQSHQPEAFTQDDVSVMRILADSVAVAIENARLLSEMQQTLERLSRYQEQEVVEAWRDAIARHRTLYSYDASFGAVLPVDELPPSTLPERVEVLSTETGRNALLVPVRVRGQVVGLLRFEAEREWRDEELRLADMVGEQLSLALDNARLLEESRLRALNERARSAIVARLRASSSVEAVLRSLVQEVGRALNLQRARVQLIPIEERETSSTETHETQ